MVIFCHDGAVHPEQNSGYGSIASARPAIANQDRTALLDPSTTSSRAAVSRRHGIWQRALAGIALLAVTTIGGALLMHASIEPVAEAAATAISKNELLANVRTWGYQLQELDPAQASRSGLDLIVVDEALNGERRLDRRAESLKSLKRKPDGSRRLVLAYLSIGEAEEYRGYWNKGWVAPGAQPAMGQTATDRAAGLASTPAHAAPSLSRRALPIRTPSPAAPVWLGDENPDWRGNFNVRFWQPSWQAMLLGSPDAALDRIIAAGFDGVYVDRADAYTLWQTERDTVREDMIQLIERLGRYARDQQPDFLVVMQNAEELLGHKRTRAALSAVAKEDLFFGITAPEQANGDDDIASSLRLLKKARNDGLPVLVVEYLATDAKIAEARQRIEREGFLPYFAPRPLHQLNTQR